MTGIFHSGDLAIRQCQTHMQANDKVDGHGHNFGHTTFFNGGRWKVTQKIEVKDSAGNLVFEDVIINGKTERQPIRVPLRTVTIDGRAPKAWLLIEANVWHEIECLEGPAIYACVYNHRTSDGEVSTEFTGWMPAYE